ncbi:MAG: helix-turn-helix domain-containing protein [Bacteroidia bacterium]|nr:helix-turn-helix domain-containing protein [Bacteroidia bacterium]
MEKLFINALSESDLKRVFREVLSETVKSEAVQKNSERKINYLNRFEVVELLKISLPTLSNWTKEGILQSYRIGKRVLYREDEVNSSLHKVRNLKYKRGEA